jgi:hypothetical protein
LWRLKLATSYIVAIATALGSLWLAYDGLAGHARAVAANGPGPAKNLFMLGVTIVALSAVVAVPWQAHLAWQFDLHEFGFLWGWNFVVYAEDTVPSDGLTLWWIQIPSVLGVPHIAAVWAAIALIGLICLVTSSLHQGPGYGAFRKNPEVGSDINDAKNTAYRRYLGRSFARLRYGIYLGAALLAVVVAETSARYSWPASLLNSGESGLAGALNALGQEYTVVTGLYLSLLLAALYYPSITVFRNRGREYYRARQPQATLADQETWLTQENLSFTFSSNWSEFVALLAPAATGLLPHFTSLTM